MNGYILNSNKEHTLKIIEGILKKDGHCPCQIKEDDSTLCPCNNFINSGHCCCNLFIKNQ